MSTSPASPHPVDLRPLRAAFDGPVAAPGDAGWDDARRAWNLSADQHPAAVAHATSAADVVVAVGFAREHGLRVAPQGTGHGAAAMGSLAGALLLRTTRMNGVTVDPQARTARAEAGAIWQQVVEQAAAHDLAALHGSTGTVGVVGYTLGGGLGWLGRRHGLASNHVTAIELVTADGEQRRVDGDDELFWALRGGGGSFAVVTAIEFALHPLPELYAGGLFWPMEAQTELLHAYRELTRGAPDELTTTFRFLRLPPLPFVPEPLRGVPVVDVGVAYAGEAAAAEELLAPLRAVAEPIVDTLASAPAPVLATIHGDPDQPVPGIGHHALVRELTDDAAAALIGVAGVDADSALLGIELRQLGGALARPAPGHGAQPTLDGEFALYAVGAVQSPEHGAQLREELDRVVGALAPWSAPTGFINFADRPSDGGAELYDGETHARLRALKAQVDPDGLLQANHTIPAAA